jgi:hypothetical protein
MGTPKNPREEPDALRPEALASEDDRDEADEEDERGARPETDSDSAHRNAH